MAFHALADYQNHVIGWLQWEQSSLGDGAVVRFPRIWMSSGECRFMETFLVISSFRHLSISEPLAEPFTLLPGVDISNSPSKKRELISEQITEMIGKIELGYLMREPNIVFAEFTRDHLGDLEPEQFLFAWLVWAKNLLKSAWVLQDHNMDCESAFIFHFSDGVLLRSSSNFLASHSTRADCTTKELSFGREELVRWERLNYKINTYLYSQESHDFRFFMEKGYCRSGRALQFVESARIAPNAGFKIAHYISAFESLFSTSPSELSHKLSERVAFFLGMHGYSKRTVFQNMKTAYDIRSKLVHGASVSTQKVETLPDVSVICDSYLREIMQLLFGDTNLLDRIDVAPTSLDNFFDSIILGSQQSMK